MSTIFKMKTLLAYTLSSFIVATLQNFLPPHPPEVPTFHSELLMEQDHVFSESSLLGSTGGKGLLQF